MVVEVGYGSSNWRVPALLCAGGAKGGVEVAGLT